MNESPQSGPSISTERRVAILKAIPSFESLDLRVLEKVAALLRCEAYPEGQAIINENFFGDRVYLIESGVVGVYTDGPSGMLMLGKLGEGDRFGDVDLLTSTRRRRASVVALTPVVLLTLGAEDYERLVVTYPALKGDLACAASEFMQKRLEALMRAKAEKLAQVTKGKVGF